MARYIALEYRGELVALQRKELALTCGLGAQTLSSQRHGFSLSTHIPVDVLTDDGKISVARDLLLVIQSVPMEIVGMRSNFLELTVSCQQLCACIQGPAHSLDIARLDWPRRLDFGV